eukprot:TRINITY_DN7812_c0_g1_i4.p1 TRINITY_DN7812_c0_g1~~TRINITY_DN7812_c0_g1_i4.p1  ORF type:complete len:259 (-),score=47.47 TRINITY_DN7812_c0_g1_i4:306-1082(-)
MAMASAQDAVVSLVDRLLAEEMEKVTELLRESHRAVVSRLEEDLAGMHSDSCDRMLLTKAGHNATGACLGKTFETLTCNKLLEPLGDKDNISATLRGFEDVPESKMVDDQLAKATSQSSSTVVSALSNTVRHTIEAGRQRVNSMSSPKVRRVREEVKVETSRAKRIINSPMFESVFAGLIFLNALIMAFELQYSGMDTGYKLEAPGALSSARETWPHAESFLLASELFFGAVFTVEVLAKVAIFRWEFFQSLWNLHRF